MKMTNIRRSVLADIEAACGTQTHHTARRLSVAKTSVWSAVRWLRENGLVENVGYWRTTPAGVSALDAASDNDGAPNARRVGAA
jgi:hypothetical protein